MPSRIQDIENEILLFPARERALLAEKILRSFDDEENLEADRLWIEEAERRFSEYKAGKSKGTPAATAIEIIRSKLVG